MKLSKKVIIIITCSVLVCAIIATVLGVTLAKWKEQGETTQDINVDIAKYNASAPYILYYGLDSDGNFTDETENIESWAVIGYIGLIDEVIIPEIHKDTERDIEKPVTKILVHPDYINDRLSGNPIITKITLPSSIELIGSGVCSMMSSLNTVIIDRGETKLIIEDLAFAGCGKLEQFSNDRADTEGNPFSFLSGTPVIHQ